MLQSSIFSRVIVYSQIYCRLNRDALEMVCWHLSTCTQQSSKPCCWLKYIFGPLGEWNWNVGVTGIFWYTIAEKLLRLGRAQQKVFDKASKMSLHSC